MTIFLQFLRKFWYLFVIVPLAFVVLFQRNTITGRTAERDAAKVQVVAVTEANKSLQTTLDTIAKARIDNDAIATKVAELLSGNQTRLVETRTIIERLKRDDATVRDWAGVPVPSGVREALRPRKVDPAPR